MNPTPTRRATRASSDSSGDRPVARRGGQAHIRVDQGQAQGRHNGPGQIFVAGKLDDGR